MAYTASLTNRSTFGNQQVAFYTVTADGASGTVSTGFGTIESVTMTPGSITTNNSGSLGRVRPNGTAAGVDSPGTVGFSGFTSGDVMYLMVYGR